MILVAGGQLDPNIGRVLRRMLERGTIFRDLLVGPDLCPRLTVDLQTQDIILNGEVIAPTACFVRHDVFLHQRTANSATHAASLNWFYAVRGWLLGQSKVQCFNRFSYMSENNKIQNLLSAKRLGLTIPTTIVTNDFDRIDTDKSVPEWIQKPVAGGEHTTLLDDFLEDNRKRGDLAVEFPRFVQPRLLRPELRVYRIGSDLFGFHLESDDLDYRERQRVKILPATVPNPIAGPLIVLCDELGLNFAAADFMKNDDGEYVFLEINSQPMFAAFDRMVGGRLCDSMIDYLEIGPTDD